ncbi:hypothetical protein JRQ81_013551, partial [Phrynocephalus forsythii]
VKKVTRKSVILELDFRRSEDLMKLVDMAGTLGWSDSVLLGFIVQKKYKAG